MTPNPSLNLGPSHSPGARRTHLETPCLRQLETSRDTSRYLRHRGDCADIGGRRGAHGIAAAVTRHGSGGRGAEIMRSRQIMMPRISRADLGRLGERIGEGSYGTVRKYTCWGMSVAVKEMQNESSSVRASLCEEGALLAGLAHENVVRIFGGEWSGRAKPYIVMELCDGSLRGAIRCKKTPAPELQVRIQPAHT